MQPHTQKITFRSPQHGKSKQPKPPDLQGSASRPSCITPLPGAQGFFFTHAPEHARQRDAPFSCRVGDGLVLRGSISEEGLYVGDEHLELLPSPGPPTPFPPPTAARLRQPSGPSRAELTCPKSISLPSSQAPSSPLPTLLPPAPVHQSESHQAPVLLDTVSSACKAPPLGDRVKPGVARQRTQASASDPLTPG